MHKLPTRRHFLQALAAGTAVSLTPKELFAKQHTKKARPSQSFKFGMASYTMREFDLDKTLETTKKLGLEYIALKSFHLPLESSPYQIAEVVAKIKAAGIKLYGGGVIYMRNANEVNQAFAYAKAAGMSIIIGKPYHEVLDLVNEKVKQYDIRVAIHNHGPSDKMYPTPESVYKKIKNLDPRIGICNDIGHTMRAGIDPSESSERVADRLYDIHIKDVSEAARKGHTVEMGRGVIDIPKFLRTLKKINYTGVVSFEYEKDGKDPFMGLAESVGYVKGALAAI